MAEVTRRKLLGAASIFALTGFFGAAAQPPAPTKPADTDWLNIANDLASTRYAPLDQINAANFNQLEVAWRFSTNSFGPRWDAYFNCTPLVVKGRLYSTAGTARAVVALDAASGELQWSYRHDEGQRTGTRQGSGFGLSYWTDGKAERILCVTRSYQLISLDAKTGAPDPAFGVNGAVDLRKDWDQEVDPIKPVAGLHAPPLVAKNTVIVGTAASTSVQAYVRGYDVHTGKRKWIFHTIPRKGEFGYDTWVTAGQAEKASNAGVWAPMSADEQLGLVYLGVETPAADLLGTGRHGNSLFSNSIVALDIETGVRKWHYQLEHHGLWDSDVPCAAILCDIPHGGRIVKALAQPTKQSFLFVLDRVTGKPIWPIVERRVAKGDVPGEWYSPTQPIPSAPPPFDKQGTSEADLVDFTPELKKRALEIASKYRMGPLYTPPALVKPDGATPWGTLVLPGTQGGANWPGGAYDPDTSTVYIFSKTAIEPERVNQNTAGGLQGQPNRAPANTNDNDGGAFGGLAGLGGGVNGMGGANPNLKDGMNDPIVPSLVTIEGIPLMKPPYGRITAIDLRKGSLAWQVAHGETPDFIRNHPRLKGLKIPRTGQGGILGVLATKSLVICGDAGLFTDDTGRKAARLRAYDKATGKEVGAVVLDKAQTGSPMTYMRGGRQYIVLAIGGVRGAELVAYRLPVASASPVRAVGASEP